jgi:hypothetical protein
LTEGESFPSAKLLFGQSLRGNERLTSHGLEQLHGKCIREIEGKENRSLAEKLDAARETGTVLASFTSFRMTLSTRGGYIHHGTAKVLWKLVADQ